MNKFVIITLFVNIIFAVNQWDYFLEANKYAPTYIYAAGFIVCVILHIIACILFIRFHKQPCSKLKIASVTVALVSMLLISLMASDIYGSMPITGYLGYVSILLGLVGYYKHKSKFYVSFILWGIFIFTWTTNWYESNYLVTVIE